MRKPAKRPQRESDTDAKDLLSEVLAEFRPYAVSSDKVRAILDKRLGDKTLTEELYAMREGR